MDVTSIKLIVEGALLASRQPLTLDKLQSLFEGGFEPEKADLREALAALRADYEGRAIELQEVASGWRTQVRSKYSPWISRLWEEKPQKYSRALLETLSLIAYKQPITRGEIEEVRGVAVSSNITRTLLERDWVRIVGHREVPGRPALYATTKEFLDYFNLKSLEDLPSLQQVRDLSEIQAEIELPLAAQSEAPRATVDGHEHGSEDAPEQLNIQNESSDTQTADEADTQGSPAEAEDSQSDELTADEQIRPRETGKGQTFH